MLFIHEISHLSRKDLPYFSTVWNLLAGIPLMLPSFMYRGVHLDHHKRNSYGTADDGEYSPFGSATPLKFLAYFLQSFTVPVVLFVRFSILNPVSLLHPALRKLLMERGSALAIQFEAKRKIPTGIDLRNWKVLELLTSLYVYTMVFLFLTHVLLWPTLLHFYFVMVAVLFVNSARTLAAHRYNNHSLQEMAFQDQLLDSVNLEGNLLFHEIVAPVGLRSHALHHLFPSMPYHSLDKAHQRLKSTLPADSFYHQCNEPNLGTALGKLWHSAKESQRSPTPRHAH
jgi:fatty acid desaturase